MKRYTTHAPKTAPPPAPQPDPDHGAGGRLSPETIDALAQRVMAGEVVTCASIPQYGMLMTRLNELGWSRSGSQWINTTTFRTTVSRNNEEHEA